MGLTIFCAIYSCNADYNVKMCEGNTVGFRVANEAGHVA